MVTSYPAWKVERVKVEQRSGEIYYIDNLYHILFNNEIIGKAFYACNNHLFIVPVNIETKLDDIPRDYIKEQIEKLVEIYD